jgi:hypothetical protein
MWLTVGTLRRGRGYRCRPSLRAEARSTARYASHASPLTDGPIRSICTKASASMLTTARRSTSAAKAAGPYEPARGRRRLGAAAGPVAGLLVWLVSGWPVAGLIMAAVVWGCLGCSPGRRRANCSLKSGQPVAWGSRPAA